MTFLLAILIAVPEVVLSDDHQSLCLVGVGDPMPRVAATAPGGKSTELDALLGDKATVVAIHPARAGWMSRDLLADLGPDIGQPYAGKGVRVIAVGIDRAAEPTAGVTVLKTSQSAVSEALGSGKLPRVYVLDSAGTIVWFDIEYSLSTRRELRGVIGELCGAE